MADFASLNEKHDVSSRSSSTPAVPATLTEFRPESGFWQPETEPEQESKISARIRLQETVSCKILARHLYSGDESNGSEDGDTQAIRASDKGKGRKDYSSDQDEDNEEGGNEESNEDDDLGAEEGSIKGDNESSAPELEDLTRDELLALARQLQDEQRLKQSKKTHKKHDPLPPKTPLAPLPPRVPSEQVNDDSVDQATVAELGSDSGEINRGGRAARVQDIDPKDLKNAKNRVSRGALCSITGWKSCQDADVTQRDETGEPVYEKVIPPTTRAITPAWEEGFPNNWSHWGAAYIQEFRSKASKDAYATHLACMSDTEIENHLFKNTWDYCYRIVKKKMDGTFESARQAKNIRSLDRHRKTNLIVLRESARKQVGLDDKKYDFLTTPGAQYPELSHGEIGTTKGVTHRTRIEPAFMSEEVAKLKGVLDQAAKFQTGNDIVISYVKQEYSAPMVKPGEKRTKGDAPIKYPRWAISDKWVEENLVEYENSKYMIDMRDRDAPDHTEVYEEHGNISRTYLDDIPTPSKPCSLHESINSRSPSVATHSRSTSPLVSTTSTPLMRAQMLPLNLPRLVGMAIDPQLFEAQGETRPIASDVLGLNFDQPLPPAPPSAENSGQSNPGVHTKIQSAKGSAHNQMPPPPTLEEQQAANNYRAEDQVNSEPRTKRKRTQAQAASTSTAKRGRPAAKTKQGGKGRSKKVAKEVDQEPEAGEGSLGKIFLRRSSRK
ncbi:hypothetical protein RhiLY_07878 [Ceratobasidium sp. AG-Ba]|nr:hypothetical protein RhiLY_07878 [Ceratobasidium sp. AG-Ba]